MTITPGPEARVPHDEQREQRPHSRSTAVPPGLASVASEGEFMDALRALKTRSGLSYRDIAARMLRADPHTAIAKSTLATLFTQHTLPRRPSQLDALLDVLTSEVNDPAVTTSHYQQVWTRVWGARTPPAPHRPAPSPGPLGADWSPTYRRSTYHPARISEPSPHPGGRGGSDEPADDTTRSFRIGSMIVYLVLCPILDAGMMPPNYQTEGLLWLISPAVLAVVINLVGWTASRAAKRPPELPQQYLRIEGLPGQAHDRAAGTHAAFLRAVYRQ